MSALPDFRELAQRPEPNFPRAEIATARALGEAARSPLHQVNVAAICWPTAMDAEERHHSMAPPDSVSRRLFPLVDFGLAPHAPQDS